MKTIGTPEYRAAVLAAHAIKTAKYKRRAINKWSLAARKMLVG